MIKKLKYSFILSFLYAIPLFVYGQTGITESADKAGNALENIASFMRNILLGLAVLFTILSAYKFLTAGGDPEEIKEAKKMLAYTLVAIIIAFIATGIVPLIESIF